MLVKNYKDKILYEAYLKKNRKKKKYKKHSYKDIPTVKSGNKSTNLTYFKHTH